MKKKNPELIQVKIMLAPELWQAAQIQALLEGRPVRELVSSALEARISSARSYIKNRARQAKAKIKKSEKTKPELRAVGSE